MLDDEQSALVEGVSARRLMQHVVEMALFQRLSGSPQEFEAFRYVEDQMKDYGFSTSLLFHDAYISIPLSATVKVVTPERRELRCITHSFGLSTPDTGVTAPLVSVGSGSEAEYQGLDVRGKFVLIDGLASPGASVVATRKGALGQVHVGPDDHIHEMIVSGVWGNPDDLTRGSLPRTHVVSIGRSDGERLQAMLAHGDVTISVNALLYTRWTRIPLLVADITGNDGTGQFLLMSGHVDSWYYGAMDNGSANATMMEVARLIGERRGQIRRGLRLCFWSGHSHGRYAGSAWYADNHWEDLNKNCVMHLNVDSTGGIGASVLWDANVMDETRQLAGWAVVEVTGQDFKGKRISRMGDQSFWGIGIPSLFVGLSEQPPSPDGVAQPDLGWWWHTPDDLPDKIDPRNLVRDTQVYALVAHRLTTAAVLPFDYAAHMASWISRLTALQRKVGDRFDLTPVLTTATALQQMITRLHSTEPESDGAIGAKNRWLLDLGRCLIPVNFTSEGRFGHDPALTVPELPDLEPAMTLASTDPGSDEAKFLTVRLTRARNRALAALDAAMCATERAPKAMG